MHPKTIIYGLAVLMTATFDLKSEVANDTFSINEEMVFNHMVGNYESMMIYPCVPNLTKKLIARDLYALMFECWLDKNYRHIAELNIRTARKMVEYSNHNIDSKDPISYDDPLDIAKYYQNGILTGDGLVRCEWSSLKQADVIFAHKDKYMGLVASFHNWEKNEVNK